MMKVVRIVKTIGPEGNWERTRAYVERKPVKMSVVDALLAEEGWTRAEDTRVEKPCNWLPYKEIKTIVLTKSDNSIFMDFRERMFREMGIGVIGQLKEKVKMKNTVLKEHDTILRSWERRASDIRIANCEYIHDENGRIVGGKAPNAKKVREFYKKRDKFLRLRGKKH